MSRRDAAPIDLTGRPPQWPESVRQLWTDCVGGIAADAAECLVPADPQGEPALRAALAAELGLDAATLVITGGVRSAAALIGGPDRRWLLERPTFAGVGRVLASRGVQVRRASWAGLPSSGPATAYWVTSPARNPDGASLTAESAAYLTERAAASDIVVQNETYRWYAEPARRIDGAVLVGTLAKWLGPGVRVGWAWHRDWSAVRPGPVVGTLPPRPWQRALAAFLVGGGLRELRRCAVAGTRAAAEALVSALPPPARPATVTGPSLLLPIRAGDPAAAREAAAGRGVLVGIAADFDLPAPALRISLAGIAPADAHAAGLVLAELVGPTCRVGP
jgi:DNA-binding transcriptional MocR family regulator